MTNKETQPDVETVQVTIDRVLYARLVNLGNYENERIEVEAKIPQGSTAEEVLDHLKTFVGDKTHSKDRYEDWCDDYWKKNRELKDLESKLEKTKRLWETATDFMVAQGLKDAGEVPKFPALAPSSTTETETAEIVEKYDEEDLDDIPM